MRHRPFIEYHVTAIMVSSRKIVPMTSPYAERIERIRRLPDELENCLGSADQDVLRRARRNGDWSVAQHVHHLADTHMICFRRFKLILTQEQFTFTLYQPDRLAEMPDADDADVHYSLAILRGLHARWAILMTHMSEEDWARSGTHPMHGEITLEHLLTLYADHGDEHLRAIQAILQYSPRK